MIGSLYIIGGDNFKDKIEFDNHSNVVFLDKINSKFYNQFSIISNFEENQNFLREKWLTFQETVFQKVKLHLDKDTDFNYILSNLFFESAPNKISSVYQFFKIYLILDYIKIKKIKSILLINVSQEIKNFFISNSKIFNFSIKILSVNEKNISIQEIIKQLEKKNSIISLLSCLVSEFKKKKQKLFTIKNQSSKVVLSYYYPGGHSYDNGFSSKYFDKVSNLLNKKYSWLFQYVGDISKLGHENKLVKNNVNSYGFIDAFFSLKDFFKIIFIFFRIRKKLNLIKLENIFYFEKVNYYHLFKDDWLTSNSILLLKLIIFEKKISNFFLQNSQVKEVLYLLEFQPWEQILNKVAKKNGIKTKGVIHSIARQNVMNYYHSKIIHPYLHLPIFLGANSDFSKSLLLKNGFTNNQIFKIEAQRYNYLSDISRDNIKKTIKSKKSILIFTSNIRKETTELLEIFSLANVKFEKVFIKEHHLLPVEPIIKSLKKFPSFEILSNTASESFEYSDIVYIANGSSVLLESVLKKKSTVSLISLAALPIPAVEKASNLYFVYDAISLSKILHKLSFNHNNDDVINNKNDYLYLDKNLKFWREFLDK